jgi:hypothetical protein
MFGEPETEEFFKGFLFRLYTIFIGWIKGVPDGNSFFWFVTGACPATAPFSLPTLPTGR